ncbi:serine/threonine-protein kinase BLUS1-like [Solanum pennellii]|uniref:Serine/threonine-protein kinase BLUS1-like n=1 Tax=Solanum pennellii TaxID=28526 RepID=A0ABM1VAF5_SOLPN|nr:serine/threonine-protein kinase BLUS1-like [Solanum pennellii]
MDLQQKIAASLEYLAEYRRHYAPRKKSIPEFTYDPGLGKVFIDQNVGTRYVLLEIIGKCVQLRPTHNYNLLDVIYKASYYTPDWIEHDSFLPSGYATVKFIRPGQEIRQSKLAGQSIRNSNIINFDKWLIQRFRQGFCVALPYMSEGSLRYILSTRFHNGLPEDCIAIALKQALLGLFDLHFSGLVHKRFSAGNIYVNFKSNVEIKLGFAATIYDSELESPLFVSHGTELGLDSTVAILPKNPGGIPNLELGELYKWAAAPEVFYSKYEEELSQVPSPLYQDDNAHTVHSDIWLVGVAALELAYGNLRISDREDFEAMIKKIKRSRRLPDKLEDVLEEINVEEGKGKGKGKMKKAVVYFNDKLKYVKGKRKFSKEFEELVLDCLSSKESKRPSVGDLLQRPFFRNAKNLQWFQRRVLYAKNPMAYC